MKSTHNHESDWPVSSFILFYLLAGQVKAKFSAVSKSQSLYFSCKLSNRQFMEFAIFILDVVNSLSVFSKVSQERNISRTSVNNSWQNV